MFAQIDITGERYGRLVAIRITRRTRSRHTLWLCRCDCGVECIVRLGNLRSGGTRSCGCAHRDAARGMNLRHGHAIVEGRSRAYRIWGGMHTRCSNPNRSNWKYYGGAGIRVCERWSLFENFLRDMGEPPPGHSIDRIDPYGDYEPENCRWATPEVQARNQRRHASLGG